MRSELATWRNSRAEDVARDEPTYADLVETLEFIKKNWDNPWMRFVIEQTLDNKFDWRDE